MSNSSGNNAILKSEGQAGISTSLNIFPSYHMIIKIAMHSLMANLLQSNEAIKMHFACLFYCIVLQYYLNPYQETGALSSQSLCALHCGQD